MFTNKTELEETNFVLVIRERELCKIIFKKNALHQTVCLCVRAGNWCTRMFMFSIVQVGWRNTEEILKVEWIELVQSRLVSTDITIASASQRPM